MATTNNFAIRVGRLRRNWQVLFPSCSFSQCATRKIWWHFRRKSAGIPLGDSWYCTALCFERALRQIFAPLVPLVSQHNPVPHRIPLGLLMVSRGQLKNEQLQTALRAQRAAGSKNIGYWLETLGYATEQQVIAALAAQRACPVFVLSAEAEPECAKLLPLCMLESFRMIPVHYSESRRMLYVAFCEKIDYTALYAIEQMLNCRTQPCLVGSRSMECVLKRIAQKPHPSELLFERVANIAEMARITSSYVLKLGAEAIRAVACGEYVWLRLQVRENFTTLLFRTCPLVETSLTEPLDFPILVGTDLSHHAGKFSKQTRLPDGNQNSRVPIDTPVVSA